MYRGLELHYWWSGHFINIWLFLSFSFRIFFTSVFLSFFLSNRNRRMIYSLIPVLSSLREKQTEAVVTNHLTYWGLHIHVSCQKLHHTRGKMQTSSNVVFCSSFLPLSGHKSFLIKDVWILFVFVFPWLWHTNWNMLPKPLFIKISFMWISCSMKFTLNSSFIFF